MFSGQLMKYEVLPWVILFLPLLAAGIITLFTLKNEKVSATLSVGAILIGFLSSLFRELWDWSLLGTGRFPFRIVRFSRCASWCSRACWSCRGPSFKSGRWF